MKDLFYQELYKQNQKIKKKDALSTNEQTIKNQNILVDAIVNMVKLGRIARKEGLLALEDATDSINNRYLKNMIITVVDGTDPITIEEMYTAKYFSLGLEDYEALQYLIHMHGILAIQEGENPYIIGEKLSMFVPDSVADLYYDKVRKLEEEKRNPKETELSVIEKYYTGDDVAVEYGEDAYFLIKIMDYIVKTINDRNIQRLLRDVDNKDLMLMMRGFSGEARKRIFDNMSTRLGIMIAEDMDRMGAVKVKDISSATFKILKITEKLISHEAISCAESDLITTFVKIIDFRAVDENKIADLKKSETDLQRLLKNYEKQSSRIIDPIA